MRRFGRGGILFLKCVDRGPERRPVWLERSPQRSQNSLFTPALGRPVRFFEPSPEIVGEHFRVAPSEDVSGDALRYLKGTHCFFGTLPETIRLGIRFGQVELRHDLSQPGEHDLIAPVVVPLDELLLVGGEILQASLVARAGAYDNRGK